MSTQRTPAIFISHGAPLLALDEDKGRDFRLWGQAMPKAEAVLVFSAHWQTERLRFGETLRHDKLIYDFSGFPQPLYELQYPAPGAPELITPIRDLLGDKYEIVASDRGLDHGVYVPFIHLWPAANVPVLQMTMPYKLSTADLFELGWRLAPLREQGVVIVGSGALTHNLGEVDLAHQGPAVSWSAEFDAWIRQTLVAADIEALLQWETRAPHAKRAHPTPEHFRPLLIAAGAAAGDAVQFPIEGFEYGSLSRRCVQFG